MEQELLDRREMERTVTLGPGIMGVGRE